MAKTILVVDDSSSLRTVVKMALTRAGYDVLEAGDGRQALAELEENAYQGILLGPLLIAGIALLWLAGAGWHSRQLGLPSWAFR